MSFEIGDVVWDPQDREAGIVTRIDAGRVFARWQGMHWNEYWLRENQLVPHYSPDRVLAAYTAWVLIQ